MDIFSGPSPFLDHGPFPLFFGLFFCLSVPISSFFSFCLCPLPPKISVRLDPPSRPPGAALLLSGQPPSSLFFTQIMVSRPKRFTFSPETRRPRVAFALPFNDLFFRYSSPWLDLFFFSRAGTFFLARRRRRAFLRGFFSFPPLVLSQLFL